MRRILLPVMIALAVAGSMAAPASASAQTVYCFPESLTLLGTDGKSICLAVPTPSITPPFTAYAEQNGAAVSWCLYSAANYGGFMLRVPPFSRTYALATFASGRPC